MQKELGIGVGHAASLNLATREAAAGGFMYGERMEDSWKRAQDLVEEWGVINKETERSVSVASDLERTYGVSTTAAAQLAAIMAATSDSTKDVLMSDMGKEMKVLQKSGIPVGKVMEEIAADTDFFAGHMKDGGKNIFKAAAWAKRLGMSMSTISGSAEKLLDWETSINAEMEASVLLGRSVNMERARQLFFDGKHEAAMKAIMQQVGSEADFTAMNLAQRESLAEAAGMSLTDLSKMVAAEGTLARMTYEERLEHEKKNKISANLQKIWGAIVNTFRKLYMNYITPIGKHLMKMMGFSGDLTGNFEMAGKAAKFIEKHVGGILKWVKDTSIEFIDWIKKIGTTEEGVFSLKKMFSGLWTATKEKAVEFFDYLVTKVPEVMDKIVAKFQEWWTKLDGITKLIIGLTIAIPLIAPLLIPIGGAISAIFTSLTGGLTALGAGGVLALKGVGILIAVFAGLAAGIYLVGKAMDTAGDGFGKFVDLYARTFLSFLKGITVAIVELVPHVVNLAAIVGGVLIDAFTIFKDLVIGVIDAITGLVVGTFTSIYTTFERFAKIGREGGLGMAAIGIVEIGAALAGFGVGSAIGGVFSAIGDFFGGDQLKKFEKFSEIAPSLAEAGLGISQIADGMDRISKIKVNKLADIGNTFKVNFGEAAADISIRQDEKTSKKMDKLIELLSESDGEGRKTREALKSISTIEIEAQHMEMGKLKSAISDIRRSI